MTNLNISKGDIGETDEENDKANEKLEKQAANKTKRINAARGKTSAKNDRQSKLALVGPVVLDGNLQVATGKTADALVKEETKKTKVAKVEKPKTVKQAATPQYLSRDTNANGKTLMSPELVVKVFSDKDDGLKNAQIAEKYNISVGSVSTILSGPEWFRSRMTRYGKEQNINWTYPTRAEKDTEKKAGE